tara:strand:- start:247 stop:579 length:333 start_codon:yes stop_codon:yes gene_type:complete
MDVILASHAHHVPQVGLPQNEPVTKAIILNIKPDGAKLFAIVEKYLFLNIKLPNDKIAIIEKMPKEVHADGTWTYIILTLSLCLKSGGDKIKASIRPIDKTVINKKKTYF